MLSLIEPRTAPANGKQTSMLQRLPQGLLRYGMTVLAVAVASLLRIVLWPLLGGREEYLLFWPAVFIAAWYGGFWPGVWATTLCALAAIGIFYWPLTTMGVGHSFGLLVFIMLGTAVSLLFEKVAESQRAKIANMYHRSLI